MDQHEALSWRIWRMDGIGKAVLVGGLVAYIPLVNLVLLGYFGLWTRRLVRREGLALPEWNDPRPLLEEFLRSFLPFLVWVLAPLTGAAMLTAALMAFFHFLFLGFFAPTLAFLPLVVVGLLSPPAFVLSLIRIHSGGSLGRALDVPGILRCVIRRLREALFPLFQFYGILVLGWPLAGFAGFLATLPLIAQLVLLFREEDRGSSPL